MRENKNLIKFLHVADTHLDIKRHGSETRSHDFFMSLYTTFEKYAAKEAVSFVLIAGDTFDKRSVTSEGMDHAIQCFQLLKDAKIPCLVISGNHDNNSYSSDSSWLRSLCRWKFITLLEPTFESGKATLKKWDEKSRTGGYIEIGNVRIYGNVWGGSSTEIILTQMVDGLRDVHDASFYNIMMLHADIQGFIHKGVKGLSVDKMLELKKYINYLALGHIHESFVIENWAYMPGSLNWTAIDQTEKRRGCYLVEVDTVKKTHKATLMQGYQQRPAIRLSFELNKDQKPEEFQTLLFEYLDTQLTPFVEEKDKLAPIIELTITGNISFKTNLLDLNKVKEKIKKKYNPLLCLVKNNSVPAEYAAAVSDPEVSRAVKEQKVIEDLISKDVRYKNRSGMADMIFEAKRLALFGEDPAKISAMIEKSLSGQP